MKPQQKPQTPSGPKKVIVRKVTPKEANIPIDKLLPNVSPSNITKSIVKQELTGNKEKVKEYIPEELPPNIPADIPIKDLFNLLWPKGWNEIKNDIRDEVNSISDIIAGAEKANGICLPPRKYIFESFRLTPLNKVKVVFIGQDPYHNLSAKGIPDAMGLAFGVIRGNKIPPSLNNIFKEIRGCFPELKIQTSGDLSCWAKQGVLLMNACLTVQAHQAGSHGRIWLGLTVHVIKKVYEANPKTVFIALGKNAQDLADVLGEKAKIVKASHPSPLSATRASKDCPAFIGSKIFLTVNELLVKDGLEPIDWNVE